MCKALYLVAILFICVKWTKELRNQREFRGRLDALVEEKGLSPDAIRCTRRFTPGACVIPVVPVWFFIFHKQNCSERLGCPMSRRANRFISYAECRAICRDVINLYSEILMHDQTITVTNNTENPSTFDYVFTDIELPKSMDNTTVEENMEKKYQDGDVVKPIRREYVSMPDNTSYQDTYKNAHPKLADMKPQITNFVIDRDGL